MLCVGRVYADLVLSGLTALPEPGREVFADGLSIHAGGGAAITAAYLAGLGRQTTLVATLPTPPFEAGLRSELTELGVSLEGCSAAAPGADPQLTVVTPLGNDRAFLTRRSGIAFDAARLRQLAKGADHIHVGELATLVENSEIIEIAAENRCTLSADCGWDDSLEARAVAPLIAALDVFLPNRAESDWLISIGVDPNAAALTVTKCGSGGAEAEGVRIDAEPVKVADATGAGDAFNAGFLDAWLSGATISACLSAANHQGARAVSAIGGTGALTRRQAGDELAKVASRG